MRTPTILCSLCFSYVMEDLTVFEHRRFTKHLRQCSACQQEIAEIQELRRHAEIEFVSHRPDSKALYVSLFSRQFYFLAASAMVVLIGLSIALPHPHRLMGRFKETAADVHVGLTEPLADLNGIAHRVFRIRTHIHIS